MAKREEAQDEQEARPKKEGYNSTMGDMERGARHGFVEIFVWREGGVFPT